MFICILLYAYLFIVSMTITTPAEGGLPVIYKRGLELQAGLNRKIPSAFHCFRDTDQTILFQFHEHKLQMSYNTFEHFANALTFLDEKIA